MKTASRRPTQQQLNHHADALNPNRLTSGNNITNAHVHGNRGAQLNPNRQGGSPPATPGTPGSRRAGK